MRFEISEFKSLFAGGNDSGINLYADNGMTVEAYHIKKDSRIFEKCDNNNLLNENHVITYIVIEGKLEICIQEECIKVESGRSVSFIFDQNFTCWALEDSSFFAIHNCVEPEIDNTPKEIVDAVRKVELADTYLSGHNYRVGKYSMLIMQALEPQRATVKFLFGASYHDVGKVVVDSNILNKTGRLTKEEFDEIKKHPVASYEMLEKYVDKEAAFFARWHHEKLDGSGYPDGIKAEEIPLECRVMAVADIFDALTTSRCYRSAFSFDKALNIIKDDVEAGKLDAKVYETLQRLVDSGAIIEGEDNKLKNQ